MFHNTSSMARLIDQGNREFGIALLGTGKNIEEAKQDVEKGYGFPQILYMSCGHKMTFHSPEKLPNQNIPCPCGNPDHWIVKYEIVKKQPFWRRGIKKILLRLY